MGGGISTLVAVPFLNKATQKKNNGALCKWFLRGSECKRNPSILLASFESAKEVSGTKTRPDMKGLTIDDCDVHVVFTKKDFEIDEQIVAYEDNHTLLSG